MFKHHAFTLIELLVVVTVIVVLLALLAPALDRSMEAAQKAVCATHLHAFGGAHTHYGMDNKRKLMTVPRHYKWAGTLSGNAGGLVYGMIVWLYKDTNPPEFNVENIRPYLGESQGSRIGGAWLCPSTSQPQMWDLRGANEAYYNQQRDTHPKVGADDGWYIFSEYPYFGGVGKLGPQYSTRPDQINRGRIADNGVLMADMVFRHNANFLWYNHGEYEPAPIGTPKIEGLNKLFGDGAVIWEPFSRERAYAFWNTPPASGPKSEMGDFVSTVGLAEGANAVNGDLFTAY